MNAPRIGLVPRPREEALEAPGCNWSHEPDAEAACVAACLINEAREAAFATVSSLVSHCDFYLPSYRLMFVAIAALHGRGEPIDIVTVKAELRAMDVLNTVGGVQTLGAVTDQLFHEIGTVYNVEAHARIVADRAVRRKVELFGRGLSMRAQSLGSPIAATLAGSIAALGAIPLPLTPPRNMSADVEAFFATLAGEVPPPKAPVATGLADFDTALHGGLRTGSYLLIGMSGSGKTTLTVQMAVYVAMTRGPVLFIEKEEARGAMRNKFLASLARLPLAKVVRAEENPTAHGLNQEELQALFAAGNRLDSLPLYLYALDDSDAPATINEMLAVARSMSPRPVMAFVDNLGEMKTRVDHGPARDLATKERMEDLRQGAESLDIPIWTLVHPKAGVAKSKMRLSVGDIAGGENAGRLCAGCFFLHDETRHPTRDHRKEPPVPGVLELYSDKLRGPVSTAFCEVQRVTHEHRFASTRRRDGGGTLIDDDIGPPNAFDADASMTRARTRDASGAGEGLPLDPSPYVAEIGHLATTPGVARIDDGTGPAEECA